MDDQSSTSVDATVPTAADAPGESVEARLRAAGRRMTSQRRVIAQVFDQRRQSGGDVHLTADQVLLAARESLPEMSLATVYNALNDMVVVRALSEVSPDDGPRRYDANTAHDHHHLVCTVCGRVVDVRLDHLPTVPVSEADGFDVHDVDVTFRGRCPDCLP